MSDLPKQFGDWTFVEPIGSGGMAAALVVARRVGARIKLAALKTPIIAMDEEAYGMFRDEACLACYLDHPNIVRGIEFDDNRDAPYLVMDLVDGPTLKDLCKDRRLSVAVSCFVVAEVAKALDYIHNLYDCEDTGAEIRPVHVAAYHRDCTLANIFASTHGAVLLGDLGIAFAFGQEGDRTRTIGFKGSLNYIPPPLLRLAYSLDGASPEQKRELARERDAQTRHPGHDVYLLGETFFRLLHNYPAFADHARRAGHMSEMRADLPEPVRRLLLEMLATDAADRPSARDVLNRLRDAVPESTTAGPELAAEVHRYLADKGEYSTAYDIVPAHLRPSVHRRELALQAITQKEHADYMEDGSGDTTTPRRQPEPRSAPRSYWSRRNLGIAAGTIVAIGALWAFEGRNEQARTHAPTHPITAATTPKGKVPAATAPTQSTPPANAEAQPPVADSATLPAPALADAKEPEAQQPSTTPSRRRGRSEGTGDFCELLILDTVDYSSEATVDGRKTRALQLPGQSSLNVSLGNHVVQIQRKSEVSTKRINVRTKKDCKVQF